MALVVGCQGGADDESSSSSVLACSIVSPVEGERVESPFSVELELGGLEGLDSALVSLSVYGGAILSEEEASSDGTVELGPFELAAGEHQPALAVAQGEGRCEATHTILVKGPPSISILTPTVGQSFMLGTVIALTADVDDPDEAASTLSLTWHSNLDGALGSAPIGDSGLSQPINAELSQGEHTVRAVVVDGDGSSAESSLSVSIHGPPHPPEVLIAPSLPTTNDDIEVLVVGQPTDTQYTYAWTRQGSDEVVVTDSVVPHELTTKGETWSVLVTPMAGGLIGEATEASVLVVNSAPRIAAMSIAPVPARAGDTLTCNHTGFEDDDGDTDQSIVWWFLNDVSMDSGSTFSDSFVRGDTVTCQVIPFDGESAGDSIELSLVIANTLPAAPVVSLSTLTPRAGVDPLICSVDASQSDPDGDVLVTTITWFRNGSLLVDNGAEMGITTTTLEFDTVPASLLVAEDEWTCSATVRDAEGSSPPAPLTAVVQATEVPLELVEDFSLPDTNETSTRFGEEVSPRDYSGGVSAWYFGHAT